MAFWVSSPYRMMMEIETALKNHFGEKAEVILEGRDKITVKVKEGYGEKITFCTSPEQIGGGLTESLDGKNFVIMCLIKE